VLQGDEGSNVTISVNIPVDDGSDDLFFHVSAPAGQAWVGFGFGTRMKDALIFVHYKSEDGENITVSPRIGIGHVEPQFTSAVGVTLLEGTYVDNETYNINGHCTGCRSWPLASGRKGGIDVRSIAQPMIYAIGEESPFFQTDSQEATIRQHITMGKFTMDLEAATGKAGVPTNTAFQSGVTHAGFSGGSRMGIIFHGIFMAACFVVFFPLGALLIQLPFRLAFWLHLIWQLCTVVGVIIGFSLGIYISVNSKLNSKLDSPHQGLGIATFVLVLTQTTLGFLYERIFKNTQSPTPFGIVHRFLGPTIILFGIVNGALGLKMANNDGRIAPYFAAVLLIAIVCTLGQWIFRRRKMRNKAVQSVAASNFRTGAQTSVRLQNYGRGNVAPPRYISVMPKHEEQGASQ
jgi:Cytochrome domain of cellobiose dehydrogenase/Eukaryotic cytochrome b561